jgi:hypothetical protein
LIVSFVFNVFAVVERKEEEKKGNDVFNQDIPMIVNSTDIK